MTNTAILAASALLVFAYLLDIFGRRFKLPSVVLLIVTGIALRQGLEPFAIHLRWVDPVVPVLGTLGLILIVLEGALDLTLTRERTRLIAASSASAVLGFAATLALFAFLFHVALGFAPALAALAAIPFAVISSAVAIPSAAQLPARPREFVVYESSISDIVGVLVFYAWLEAEGSIGSFAGGLVGGGLLSLVAAVAAAIGMYYLISKVEGHVRFLPLLAGLVLLYAVGKALHLSPLILVLICGLLLNNPNLIAWNAAMRRLHSPDYDRTLGEFKGIVAELTFAAKSFFFLLLGYWTDLHHMLEPRSWLLAAAILGGIYATRWAILAALRQEARDRLVWLAPRGLITVLLFITATEGGRLDAFPFGTVMLVVLASATLTALAQRGASASAADAGEAGDPPATEVRP